VVAVEGVDLLEGGFGSGHGGRHGGGSSAYK